MASQSRLSARPGIPVEERRVGLFPLGLGRDRDGLLFVPDRAGGRLPLVVLLHGAGSSARRAIELLLRPAEQAGLVLLAVDARDATWDVLRGGFGPDVSFLDAALAHSFARVDVDPGRVALAGFSDGASYALCLGLGNGDLFGHLVAFSPGFWFPADAAGRPRIFVSHGVDDAVLPIDRCSRRLVPALRSAGYDVLFREFAGGHTVPDDIARAAVDWMLDARGSATAPRPAGEPARQRHG